MLKFVLLLCLGFVIGCQSPESCLDRLQHDFWENYARQDYFEIRLSGNALHLPLPPSVAQSAQQKKLLAGLQERANAIEAARRTMMGFYEIIT